MIQRRIALSAAVAITTLVGCSGGDAAPSFDSSVNTVAEATTTLTPTTTAAPTTSTTTTTTTTTIPPTPEELAAAYYLEAVLPYNCAFELFNLIAADAPGGDSIYEGEFNAFYAAMLPGYEMKRDAELAFMNALIDYEWPEDVQDNIDGLTAQASVYASNYEALARTVDFNAWLNLDLDWPDNGDAAVVRAKLGLPSNINSDVEHCQQIFGPPRTSTP